MSKNREQLMEDYGIDMPSRDGLAKKLSYVLLCELDDRGVTQVEFASMIGVAVSQLRSYINGTNLPSLYTIYRMAEVLNDSIDFLVGRED